MKQLSVSPGEKLAVTQGSTIALSVLVMNIEKLLELLFVLFMALLRLHLVNGGGRSIHTLRPRPFAWCKNRGPIALI